MIDKTIRIDLPGSHDQNSDRTTPSSGVQKTVRIQPNVATTIPGAISRTAPGAAPSTTIPGGANRIPKATTVEKTVRLAMPETDVQTTSEIRTTVPNLTEDPASKLDDDKPVMKTSIEHAVATEDFVLKGVVYHNEKCLSDSSGEAQVFLVSNDEGKFVLKVYYPNFAVKKQVLKIIQNVELEFITHVYDFGKTYVDGTNHDYELMEYLEGETLEEFQLNGDINRFRKIALQAAASLSILHNEGVIHKDIKPGNFFFRDKAQTQVVLGDFGISTNFTEQEMLHRTTQARTPLYAAPEMYSDVIDGEVEVTPAVDFYSLGLTLLIVWLGENPLNTNERNIMRRKTEGRLPRMEELPERVRMIIQGLTAVNPQNRWGYNEVERWILGEDVEVDIASPILNYKSFVVDPERNLVAENVHELVPLLIENERVAIGYLYGGRITQWLDNCGNAKLGMSIRDIVTNRYPADQQAGFMACIYAMEPSYPYIDIKGNTCSDVHQMVLSLLSNQEEYALVLRNPNNRLWLYIEAHVRCNITRLRGYFDEQGKSDPRKSILCVAYELDKSIPFLAKFPSDSLKEIVNTFGSIEMSDDAWDSLYDGRLLAWMYSHEDNIACEALRVLTEGKEPCRQLSYKVLYNIDRDAAYDLKEANTPQRIGELLREELKAIEYLKDDEYAEHLKDFSDPDGRFVYFAQLHGWHEKMEACRNCFDLKSAENRDRLSAYDLRTAAYRFCKVLGVTPIYVMQDGTILDDGLKIKNSRRSEFRTEMRIGSFMQWLSVWYHEDPNNDFAEEYSYEHTLEAWVKVIGEFDQQQLYFKRFRSAQEETNRRVQEVKRNYQMARGKELLWKWGFYALCAVWILLLSIFGVSGRDYLFGHSLLTIGIPLGGMSAIIVAVRSYFRGYGFLFSAFWGTLGLFSAAIPIWTLKKVQLTYPGMVVPLIILFTLIYTAICYFTDYSRDRKGDNKLINQVMDNDIKSTLLEPLYYTFKQKSYRYKGSKFGLFEDVQNQIHSVAVESVIHYIMWCFLIGAFLMEMIVFSPHLMNVKNPNLNKGISVKEEMIQKLNNKLK